MTLKALTSTDLTLSCFNLLANVPKYVTWPKSVSSLHLILSTIWLLFSYFGNYLFIFINLTSFAITSSGICSISLTLQNPHPKEHLLQATIRSLLKIAWIPKWSWRSWLGQTLTGRYPNNVQARVASIAARFLFTLAYSARIWIL